MAKFKVGDMVRVKDKPGWRDGRGRTSYPWAGSESKVFDVQREPGQDYEVYSLRILKHGGHAVMTFMEDDLEKID